MLSLKNRHDGHALVVPWQSRHSNQSGSILMPISYLRARSATMQTRFRASPLAQRVFSGALWSLAGAVGGKGLTLISSIVAARLLGKTQFGEFGMIQNTIVSFGIFAGVGLGLTATKHVAEFRDTDPERVSRILSLSQRITYFSGIITASLIFLFADKLATNTLAAPSLAPEVRIASILLFFGALNGVQYGALAGFEAFQASARINFLSGIASFVLIIVGVMTAGLPGAVWALVGSIMISWVLCRHTLSRLITKHKIPLKPKNMQREWKTLWEFSVPAILSSLSVVPVNWACSLILVNQPSGYGEMGLLNAAIQWRNIILFVPSVLMSVCLPMLTNLGATGEFTRQRKVLLTSVALAAAIGFCAAIVVTLAGRWIMAGYGPEFVNGRSVLALQAFAAAIAAVVGVMGQFLVSKSSMWSLIFLQVIWGLVNIGLTWLFRTDGAKGIALAYLLAYVVHLCTMSTFTFWKLKQQGSSRPLSA